MNLKRRKIIFSLKLLAIFGLVGLFIINIWLPPPTVDVKSGDSIFWYVPLYGIEYLLILSGPIAALLMLLSYMGIKQIIILTGLSLLSLGVWIYIFIKDNNKSWEMTLPITVWVCIGAWSTFWGLSAGV